MDGEIAKAFERILTRQGIKFRLGMKVTGARKGNDGVTLTIEPAKGGTAEELKADIVLLSIGRRPYTGGVGLADAGVTLDERGRVKTDEHYATNVPGIYAIGDVIAGPMLAHKAEEEGVALAERLAGQAGHVNYGAIPGVVYTWPEVAAVGQTEEELKAAGVAYNVGKFPFTANARARAMGGDGRLREDPRRQDDRPVAGRTYHRPRRRDLDCGTHNRNGIWRLGRGCRAHLPCASKPERGGERGCPGGRRSGVAYLATCLRASPLTPALSPKGRGSCIGNTTPSPVGGEGWGEG